MATQKGQGNEPAQKDLERKDPLAHERGLHEKLPHNEDPIGEFRNEGHAKDQGWHQGGDWGGGRAANVGESAGEVADEELAKSAPGSQAADKNQAPGSNTSSTSTGVVTESERQTKR